MLLSFLSAKGRCSLSLIGYMCLQVWNLSNDLNEDAVRFTKTSQMHSRKMRTRAGHPKQCRSTCLLALALAACFWQSQAQKSSDLISVCMALASQEKSWWAQEPISGKTFNLSRCVPTPLPWSSMFFTWQGTSQHGARQIFREAPWQN